MACGDCGNTIVVDTCPPFASKDSVEDILRLILQSGCCHSVGAFDESVNDPLIDPVNVTLLAFPDGIPECCDCAIAISTNGIIYITCDGGVTYYAFYQEPDPVNPVEFASASILGSASILRDGTETTYQISSAAALLKWDNPYGIITAGTTVSDFRVTENGTYHVTFLGNFLPVFKTSVIADDTLISLETSAGANLAGGTISHALTSGERIVRTGKLTYTGSLTTGTDYRFVLQSGVVRDATYSSGSVSDVAFEIVKGN